MHACKSISLNYIMNEVHDNGYCNIHLLDYNRYFVRLQPKAQDISDFFKGDK